MSGFRGGPDFAGFLAEIRPYIPAIREMRHYDRTVVHGQGASVPSLYDWAGGQEALERLTDAFYREVLRDQLLEPLVRSLPCR
jgi:hemoglobin